MANVLEREKQERVTAALVEGSSIRSVERMTGVHRDTIMRLMQRVGAGCETLMDAELRDLGSLRVQVDELWGFVAKKQRHVRPEDDPSKVGDFWTFVAIDADSKLVPTFKVGKRDARTTHVFMRDLASRLSGRVQISADALRAYVDAVDYAFSSDVDFGQIVKSYEAEPIGPGRYSPPKVVGVSKRAVWGDPDPDHISTSYVERLTSRPGCRSAD
jgi:IS1 family transposase